MTRTLVRCSMRGEIGLNDFIHREIDNIWVSAYDIVLSGAGADLILRAGESTGRERVARLALAEVGGVLYIPLVSCVAQVGGWLACCALPGCIY